MIENVRVKMKEDGDFTAKSFITKNESTLGWLVGWFCLCVCKINDQ